MPGGLAISRRACSFALGRARDAVTLMVPYAEAVLAGYSRRRPRARLGRAFGD